MFRELEDRITIFAYTLHQKILSDDIFVDKNVERYLIRLEFLFNLGEKSAFYNRNLLKDADKKSLYELIEALQPYALAPISLLRMTEKYAELLFSSSKWFSEPGKCRKKARTST